MGGAADEELTRVSLTGEGLAEPLVVDAERSPERCSALYREIDWLVGAEPDAEEPDEDAELGPQYTLVAELDGEPRYEFTLYPLAEGGPRVFRPEQQPDGDEVDEGWFHGRVGMPETLTGVGVPLGDQPWSSSGAGGGALIPEATEAPEESAFGFVEDWRNGMALTIAVTVAMVVGLGGVALLLRRRA